jgi:hypothetical protein
VWNGASFGSGVLLDDKAQAAGNELMDAAYEGLTGRCMVVWSAKNSTTPNYRIWSGSAWGPEQTMPDIGAKSDQDRLAADPASNRIIALFLDKQSDVNAVVWSGSAWGAATEFETSAPAVDRRGVDVAFEPGGTRALVMYGQSSLDTPLYRTFDGTSWSAEQIGPDIGDPPSVIQLSPLASGRGIFIGIERKNDGGFSFMRWNGTTITGLTELAPDLGGPNGNECFMFCEGGTAPESAPRITSWSEADPHR